MERAIGHEFSDDGNAVFFIAGAHEEDEVGVAKGGEQTSFTFKV